MALPPDTNATSASPSSEYLVADTYSLTDAQLADSIEFLEEIGFGNWGSVWSCRSRLGSSRRKLAVKLVHRTTERTTAARVRSIWNEMKIVRTLKDDRHPAIIDFHSFIITPSYALITMEYLPRLVPVEVREPKAKVWFESLLGGVAHLHARGIVHNDIKPANILLSRNEQPVLVDFGFAERYELLEDAESFVEVVSSSSISRPTHASASRRASTPKPVTSTKPVPFESSLAYGTPEYLSPERARGYKHDTRTSDVWSLGVTFFEIITGRTPFELDDSEEFTTKEDLERYWARTNSGSWVGTWKMSSGLEKLLVKMLRPDPLERTSAADALADSYFTVPSIDAEITSVRLTANGKDLQQQILTIAGDMVSTKAFAAATPRSASPVTDTTRSKLSALQNLMAKQPQLPSTLSRTPKISRKPSGPNHKENNDENRKSTPTSRAPTPNDKPLPMIVDEKPRSRSFFSTHKRTKSAATTSMATPLTPKAVAPAPPPRAPPPTPCTPEGRRAEEIDVPPVPVAAAAMLQKQALEKAGIVVISPSPEPVLAGPSTAPLKQARPPPTHAASAPRGPPSNAAARLRAPAPTAPNSSASKVLTPIRSALRPVPGKENISNVKVRIRAIESRNTPSISNATTATDLGATSKPKIGENLSPVKSGLRMKDRNRGQENVPEKPSALGKGKQPERPVASGGKEKVLAPKRSLLKRKPSAPLKENIEPQQAAPTDKQASRGRRALHAISRSVDLSRPGTDSPISHIRHSVRKSIDKTADFFGSNSISRRASRTQRPPLELQELQDSWDDLEKEGAFRAYIQLPTVQDTSQDEAVSPSLDPHPEPSPTPSPGDDVSTDIASKRSSRMATWIQDVEKVASETREELEREATASMSRRSSSGTLLFGTAPRKFSTEPLSPSLPPPNRRGSTSSRRAKSRNHSLLDLVAASPGTRLSAVLDDDSRRILREGGLARKPMSIGSIDSSSPPTEMPTIPTIAVEDIQGASGDSVGHDSFYALKQPSLQQPHSYHLEPSRSYQSPDATLDLSKLAEEVGVNRHPWATPRSSRPPTPRSSSPAPLHQSTIQIVTPPTPKRPGEFNNVLLSSDNVVRVGNGYESVKSHRGRNPTSSASFYHSRQSTENVATRPSYEEGRSRSRAGEPQSESVRAKKAAHRRSSIFATLRGRQTESSGISSASYFAAADEFGVPPTPTPIHEVHGSYDGLGTPRSNTLSHRLKKAFLRVVSTQDINRAATVDVAS